MLSQKINSWLALTLVASMALGASFLIIRVSQADDFTFTSLDRIVQEDYTAGQ